MDFYFTNKKIKKVIVPLKSLNDDDYRYFLIEMVIILIRIKKNLTDIFTESEWEVLLTEIKKIDRLLLLFNNLQKIEVEEFVSCDPFEPESKEIRYSFDY